MFLSKTKVIRLQESVALDTQSANQQARQKKTEGFVFTQPRDWVPPGRDRGR